MLMSTSRSAFTALTVAALLLTAACGGSADSGGTSSTRTSTASGSAPTSNTPSGSGSPATAMAAIADGIKERMENPGMQVFAIKFAGLYPLYVNKVERKGRTTKELDTVIMWLTGYTPAGLRKQVSGDGTLADFFDKAPKMNPKRDLITGVVCGVRVEDIPDPTMKAIRQLDKLVDELAKGKALEKILRQ